MPRLSNHTATVVDLGGVAIWGEDAMGLFKKLERRRGAALGTGRGVPGPGEERVASGLRNVSTLSRASLPSVPGGRDVFTPLIDAAGALGYQNVSRSESIDGVGWSLQTARSGPSIDDDQPPPPDARITVEALNRPVADLDEWESIRRILADGEPDEEVHRQGEDVRFLTHQIDDGWQSSFVRKHLAVRVRFETSTATAERAREFADGVCWNYLDLEAIDSWVQEKGLDPGVGLD